MIILFQILFVTLNNKKDTMNEPCVCGLLGTIVVVVGGTIHRTVTENDDPGPQSAVGGFSRFLKDTESLRK